jgi:release factor glutamine methyltransferase
MCCGAGNLACAVAAHVPSARVWASDLTDGCIEWTRRNVTHLHLENRVTVGQGDLFAGLDGFGLDGSIDVIVCNPPYISTGRLDTERAVLLELEPREAFDGGPYGLSIHQRVFADAPRFLKPGGWLLMEFGLGQHRQVKILADRAKPFTETAFVNDASGAPRVVVTRLRG